MVHHENISDHLHGLVVMVPSQFQLPQKTFALCSFYFLLYVLKMLDNGFLQAVVQLITKLVDDHVVRISANTHCVSALWHRQTL